MGFRLTGLILAILLMAGCQTELYSGLGEEEANRMLSTLLERGIDAEKVAKGKNGFNILVDNQDVVRSLDILAANGLPWPKYETLGQVFSGQGMISSPLEEQSRLSFALAQELAETFSHIDGVLTARAHVVLAAHDQTTGQTTPASASIFLRHTPDSQVVNMTAKIKEISAQSVPGLAFDKVSVMLVPVRSEVILSEVTPQAWATRPLPLALMTLGLAALLFLAYYLGRRLSRPGPGVG